VRACVWCVCVWHARACLRWPARPPAVPGVARLTLTVVTMGCFTSKEKHPGFKTLSKAAAGDESSTAPASEPPKAANSAAADSARDEEPAGAGAASSRRASRTPPPMARSKSTEDFIERKTRARIGAPPVESPDPSRLSGVRLSTAVASGFDTPHSDDYSKEGPTNDRKSRARAKTDLNA
jgi:hypothetical protein